MSRMTIKLQRSPSISSVKLIGQPERIPLLVWIFFLDSIMYHLQYACSLGYGQMTCIMQVIKGGEMGRNETVIRGIACLCAALGWIAIAGGIAQAQDAEVRYPRMAPIEQYTMDREAEIALARSAAPAAISADAEVLVLGPKGYETAVKGKNGFVCVTERSWANSSDASDFWNPKMRAPTCYNPAAAASFLPIFLMKTKLALAGKSKAEIGAATVSGLEKKELPSLAPGAMCYMMSKEQYLNDGAKNWH